MHEAGIEVDSAYIAESGFSIESGAEAVQILMGLDPRPTALFAVNDNTAIGALSALNKLGLSVPGDISIVGYNDIPIVSHLPIPLTTVRVPFDHIAAVALDLLFGDADIGEYPVRYAAPTLIPRKSTAKAS